MQQATHGTEQKNALMTRPSPHTYYEDTSDVHTRAIQGLLGRHLRTMYDPMVREDVPDDRVQEAIVHASTTIAPFQVGTHRPAWLFTILRNLYRSEYRKRRREVEDTGGSYTASLKTVPEQDRRMEFQELRAGLTKQPAD